MVTAKNPILSGFYPDPSICRAGEDYYIVNFQFCAAPEFRFSQQNHGALGKVEVLTDRSML